jgi:hypothetical protein
MGYLPPPERPLPSAAPTPQPGAPATQYSPDGRWYWDGLQWRPVAAPGPAWARPYAPPDARAAAAMTLVGLASAGSVLIFIGEALALYVLLASLDGTPFGVAVGAAVLVALFVYFAGIVGAAIAVPMWMHRAFRNLPALGAAPTGWSPAWAAGGWFIPLANLVIPYLVARELWRRAHLDPERPGPLVHLWWAAWIGAYVLGVAGNVAGRFDVVAGDVVGMVNDVATITAGVLLIVFIRQVSRRQRTRYAQLHSGA